jgi:hypothetical protein
MNSQVRVFRWPAIFTAIYATVLALIYALNVADGAANKPICPNCGPGSHVKPWWYGYYDAARDDGSVPFPGPHGGCVFTKESPKWHCYKCNSNWGHYWSED